MAEKTQDRIKDIIARSLRLCMGRDRFLQDRADHVVTELEKEGFQITEKPWPERHFTNGVSLSLTPVGIENLPRGSRVEEAGPGYGKVINLLRGGHLTDAQLRAILGKESPDGPEGNLFALNAQRKATELKAELARQNGGTVGDAMTRTASNEGEVRTVEARQQWEQNELAAEAMRRFHGSELLPARLTVTEARKVVFQRLGEIVKSEVLVGSDLGSIPAEAGPQIRELATLVVSLDRLLTSDLLNEEPKDHRAMRKVSLNELAEIAGVSSDVVSAWAKEGLPHLPIIQFDLKMVEDWLSLRECGAYSRQLAAESEVAETRSLSGRIEAARWMREVLLPSRAA